MELALSVEILATMQNCSALQALAYLLNFDKIVKKIEAVAQRVS